MINSKMKNYTYSRTSENIDEYGMPVVVNDEGTIKMSINFVSETINENSLYSGAQYVGLTLNKQIDANYIIQYEEEKLKVLYVNKEGKYNQVFLARV